MITASSLIVHSVLANGNDDTGPEAGNILSILTDDKQFFYEARHGSSQQDPLWEPIRHQEIAGK
jgi:hypothetical protein